MERSWEYVEGEGHTWAQPSTQTCQGTWPAFELNCLGHSKLDQPAIGYNQVIPVNATWSKTNHTESFLDSQQIKL